MTHKRLFVATAASSALLLLTQAQAAEDEPLEQVVVTGTRVAEPLGARHCRAGRRRHRRNSCRTSGHRSEPGAVGRAALVQLSAARLADGTDTIRPATLRGLAPDQTLVLRERQAASLGLARQRQRHDRPRRGRRRPQHDSDRDRAVHRSAARRRLGAVRLGCDRRRASTCACAKRATAATSPSATAGATSSYDTPRGNAGDVPGGAADDWSAPATIERDVSDGETLTVSAWKGLPLGESGFVTLAAEYKDQEHTERGGYDFRQQYPLLPATASIRAKPTFDRFNAWYGEPELEQKTLFVNAGYDLGERREALRLGELPGPRRRVGRASSAAPTIAATSSRSIRTASCRSSRPDVTDYSGGRRRDAGSSASGTWTPRWSTARTRWSSPSRTR